MTELNDHGSQSGHGVMSRPVRHTAMRMGLFAGVCTALGLGLTSLATVGTDRWIETSYDATSSATRVAATSLVTPAARVAEAPSKLIVGDEQEWLTAPTTPTEKVVASAAGSLGLGDRVVFSIAAKGGITTSARTFEVVGMEALAAPEGSAAIKRSPEVLPQVLIAREVGAAGKPLMLRLLLSGHDDSLQVPHKSL